MGKLLGGGSSKNQKTTSTTQQLLSPEQQQLFNLAMPGLLGFNPQSFPGSQLAPTNPLQDLAQQQFLAAGQGIGQQAQGAQDFSQFLQGPALMAGSNPYLQSSIDAATRPIWQGLTEQILPSIRGGADAAGQFGSSRQGIAEGIASRGALDAASGVASSMSNQNFQNSLMAGVSSLALAPQLAQMGLMPAGVTEAIGAQQRGFEQEDLNEQIRAFMEEQFLPFLTSQEMMGTALGIPGGTGVGTASGPGLQQPSPLMQAAGGAMIGGSLGPMIFQGSQLAGPIGAGIGALAMLLMR